MENIKNPQEDPKNQNPNFGSLFQKGLLGFFKKKGSQVLIAGLVACLLATGIIAFHFYTKSADLKNNPQKVAQEENDALVATVGKLMFLPTEERPTVATVADPEKLKDQSFFANAKKGDKVLIYTNAKRAILYNPSSNKIVEIAPINIGIGQQPPTPTP